MCGIAGIISLGQHLSESDLQQGERMTSILHHRGPDSRGFLSDERCFLGNPRLSVIDLSTDADLPMSSVYRLAAAWLSLGRWAVCIPSMIRSRWIDPHRLCQIYGWSVSTSPQYGATVRIRDCLS